MDAKEGLLTAAPGHEPPSTAQAERMHIVIGGHVDHGKSTVIGRLLADTGSLPEGKLEQVRASCERNSKPFEYAFLLDALKDEQSQGITIDAARVFFKTAKRDYIIIDAPGHIEFLKNMVTGAARAESALLVIDANEGVQENSRRHGYMMSMLGLKHVAIVVNKMDLVNYDQAVFSRIEDDYRRFLQQIDFEPRCFIPVSGRDGEGIAKASPAMPWYQGPTILEVLDQFPKEPPPIAAPFRMPVQGVYKFTQRGDDRRIVAGTIESGVLRPGDEVIFYPSGKHGRVRSIEAFNRPRPAVAQAGEATGFTLEDQIFVTRGEMAARAEEPRPRVTTLIRGNLFWLGRDPLIQNKDYILKVGTTRVPMRLDQVHSVIDASDLGHQGDKQRVDRHEVADCTLKLNRALSFDLAEHNATTSRFVIVDGYEIRGGGIVREALADNQSWVREKVLLRNYKWEPSFISSERRWEKYNQRARLLLITAAVETDRKTLAKDLEAQLFEDGRVVYFLGIGNVLYGVDADIERTFENRAEHLRRLAEVANLMLDAGIILIVTAAALTQEEAQIIKTAVGGDRIDVVWVGEDVTTDVSYDVLLSEHEPIADQVYRIKGLLQEKGVIFRPW